jgi:predicted Mrr-cat superfamily restriction endonuclease
VDNELEVLLLRAKPNMIDREDQFLDGLLSIGWGLLGDLRGKIKEEVAKLMAEKYPENTGALSTSQVFLFSQLPVGALVLTPSYQTRDIHVFRTKGEYLYDATREADGNQHTIEAEHIVTVRRSAFPEQICRAFLAARKPVTNFTKYRRAIDACIADPGAQELSVQRDDTRSQAEGEAREALRALLKSDIEDVRLRAALGLLSTSSADANQ